VGAVTMHVVVMPCVERRERQGRWRSFTMRATSKLRAWVFGAMRCGTSWCRCS
jgi:hypothetical protein